VRPTYLSRFYPGADCYLGAYDVSCWESDNEEVFTQFKLKIDLRIEDPKGENYYKFSFNSDFQADEELDDFDASGNYGFAIGLLL